jgi:hypothetical protein
MNVRWLVPVTREEKKPIGTASEDRGTHQNDCCSFGAVRYTTRISASEFRTSENQFAPANFHWVHCLRLRAANAVGHRRSLARKSTGFQAVANADTSRRSSVAPSVPRCAYESCGDQAEFEACCNQMLQFRHRPRGRLAAKPTYAQHRIISHEHVWPRMYPPVPPDRRTEPAPNVESPTPRPEALGHNSS